MAALYVVWVEAHVHWLRSMQQLLLYGPWKRRRPYYTNYETWPWPAQRVAVCEPKFAKLNTHAPGKLHFAMQFSVSRYLVSFPFWPNPRWRLPRHLEKFKWLETAIVCFYGGVFRDGRSNGATFEFQKLKIATDGHLGYIKVPITSHPLCWSTWCLITSTGSGLSIGSIDELFR